jgi:hypothetical protein
MDRPGIMIIGTVGVRFVRRDENNISGCDGESASIDFGPSLTFGAKNQNTFIKPARPLDRMPTRFRIPSEAFDVQADSERMASRLAEQIGGQEMDDLPWKPLGLCFHRR